MMKVDCGALFGELKELRHRARAEALIDAYNEMGYSALNVTYREIHQDFAFYEKMKAKAQFPFITASWADAKTGASAGSAPFIVKEFAPGKSVAFVGLNHRASELTMKRPDGSAIIVSDPIVAAKGLLDKLKKEHDFVVALARMEEQEIRGLVREAPGFDLILSAYGNRSTGTPLYEGNTPIVFVGHEGRHLTEVRFFPDKKGAREVCSVYLHYLSALYPVDDEMEFFAENILRREFEESQKEPQAVKTPAVKKTGQLFLSASACKSCHAEDYEIWKKSAHSKAFDTLMKASQDFNPRCIPCHTTGYKEGGFRNMRSTPEYAGVQCESCHGLGIDHAEDPKKGFINFGSTAGVNCVACHNKTQSPDFDRDIYWQKIAHGKK